jgi:uncharacterized membrane protein YcaP (DUF421 family)
MLFEDWSTLGWTLVVVPLAYLSMLVVVRISGKRSLSKLNAFDLIVTVALGSVLASIAVAPDVTLASGIAAFAMLTALQYAFGYLAVRIDRFQSVVKARPALLVRDGRLLEDVLERQRVARAEILQVLRQHGIGAVEDVAAVVLETDGNFSVITTRPAAEHSSTLEDVRGLE